MIHLFMKEEYTNVVGNSQNGLMSKSNEIIQ
jgi:hypothetical protein